jgi:GTP-binding protein HflX
LAEIFHRIEQQRHAERAVLVHLELHDAEHAEDLDEFRELVDSASVSEVALIVAKPSSFRARTLLGSGKVEEIAAIAKANNADVIIVNYALTPGQERNLSNDCECRVVDRVGLILDIFAQRAQSFEGKLQVELAQLKHMSTRLVGGWTHLERQGSGVGQRGPGETQLETDRRLVQDRIWMLERRLDKVRSHRDLSRRSRTKNELSTVVIVGYTNAGKSTLFNLLTRADVYAENRLFATLDTTIRRLHLPGVGSCALADTVGFIRHIPHDLVASFRSTLEETVSATLLLHIIDASDSRRDEKVADVLTVLQEIGAGDVPIVHVYNKADACMPPVVAHLTPTDEHGHRDVWVSAKTGEGMDLLVRAIAERLAGEQVAVRIGIQPEQGQLRARIYSTGQVLSEVFDEAGMSWLNLSLSPQQWQDIYDDPMIEHKVRLATTSSNA